MSGIFDFSPLFNQIAGTKLVAWLDGLPAEIAQAVDNRQHGKLPEWRELLAGLPPVAPGFVDLLDRVKIGRAADLDRESRDRLGNDLRRLMPWRKGPFNLFDIEIDAEWRSDWKWDRLKDEIQPLDGRLVLDVGSGNGYFGWRMVGAGARLVIGLDPFLLYAVQHQVFHHFLPDTPVHVLPLGIEALPADLAAFDTVFSMGVLYHRRSPFDHLQTLYSALRPGGELILETLVIEGEEGRVLVPHGRYAQMRNVWFIPSPATLITWLARMQFQDIRLADVTATSPQEQRTTSWMQFQSLPDFLDPANPQLTVEGYPAPQRAIFLAKRP
jgi:tRNA (mo5U34)-methyltransferase